MTLINFKVFSFGLTNLSLTKRAICSNIFKKYLKNKATKEVRLVTENELFDKVVEMSSGVCKSVRKLIYAKEPTFEVPKNVKKIKANLVDLIVEAIYSNQISTDHYADPWRMPKLRQAYNRRVLPVYEERNGNNEWYLKIEINMYMDKELIQIIEDIAEKESKFNTLPIKLEKTFDLGGNVVVVSRFV